MNEVDEVDEVDEVNELDEGVDEVGDHGPSKLVTSILYLRMFCRIWNHSLL